ncbi:MAG: hypothetical protein ACI3XA_02935 [Clostridia bacterium]
MKKFTIIALTLALLTANASVFVQAKEAEDATLTEEIVQVTENVEDGILDKVKSEKPEKAENTKKVKPDKKMKMHRKSPKKMKQPLKKITTTRKTKRLMKKRQITER